ncbi:MAG TPA: hypothetical protein VHD87_10055 [Acidimicrobiales bacterium]|nr:hypothetical protein [Acidimicrobiales bacterium]
MLALVARGVLGVAFAASASQSVTVTRPPGQLRVDFYGATPTVFDTRLDVPKAHVLVSPDGDTVTVTVI